MPNVKERKAPRAKSKKIDRELLKQLLVEHVRPWVKERKFVLSSRYNEMRNRWEYVHVDGSQISIISLRAMSSKRTDRHGRRNPTLCWRYTVKLDLGQDYNYPISLRIDSQGEVVQW